MWYAICKVLYASYLIVKKLALCPPPDPHGAAGAVQGEGDGDEEEEELQFAEGPEGEAYGEHSISLRIHSAQ